MGKLHCVAMAAQYQQANENTAWLYGCLGMALSISKSQQAFQEDQCSPLCHRQENRHRKNNFSPYTRQQQPRIPVAFLPQTYPVPALSSTDAESSTNALPVGSAKLQVPREKGSRRQLLHPPPVCPCPMSQLLFSICWTRSSGRCNALCEVCTLMSYGRVAQSCLLALGSCTATLLCILLFHIKG